MPSLVSRAVQTASRLHAHVSANLVIYRRGTAEVPVLATPLELRARTQSGEGARLRVTEPAWLVPAEALDFGDGPVRPQVGDQIVDGEASCTVVPNGSGEAWEWENLQVRGQFIVRTSEQ